MSAETVYEALKNSDKPLKATEVMEITGLERAAVDKAFKALKAEGKIESPKKCYYAATGN